MLCTAVCARVSTSFCTSFQKRTGNHTRNTEKVKNLSTVANSRLCELRIDYLIEDGRGPQWRPESAETFFSEILYGRQAVFFTRNCFQELFGLEGYKNLLENFVRCTIRKSRTVSYDPRVFFKKIFLVSMQRMCTLFG